MPADDNPNFIKRNSNNEVVTKKDIISNTKVVDKITLSDDADPELVKLFEKYNVKEVLVKDNVPDLTPFSEYTFSPEPGIGPSRATNMNNYYKQLSDTWKNNPDTIPEIIKRNLPDSELTPSAVEKLLSDLNLTLHEDTNNIVHIVDTYLHSKLSHGGGVSLAKAYANIEAGSSGFIQLSKTKTYKISGTLLDAA